MFQGPHLAGRLRLLAISLKVKGAAEFLSLALFFVTTENPSTPVCAMLHKSLLKGQRRNRQDSVLSLLLSALNA